MMTTPTTSTSSHFSIARSGSRVAPALDHHADLAHVADVADLRHGKPHPRRAEVVHDDVAVMHRVVHVVRAADLVAGNGDVDLHLERLRALLFPLVDPHPCIDAEF